MDHTTTAYATGDGSQQPQLAAHFANLNLGQMAAATARAATAAAARTTAAEAAAESADAAASAPGCNEAGQLPLPPPRIRSYQLIVSFHEACYHREFPEADMSDYKYGEAKFDRIIVTKRVPLPPSTPPQQQGTQQQTQGRYVPPWQRQQQQQQQQRPLQPVANVEVRDNHLDFPQASNASYKVCLDRRLRPVMLAVHKSATYPLPNVGGGGGNGGGGGVGGSGGVGGGGGGGGSGEFSRRDQREVQQLEHAMQNMVNLMYTERMSSVLYSGPLPLQPPLVILANEGEWRDSRVIHLKAPLNGAAEYLRLLRTQLRNHGVTLKNQNDDTAALESILSSHHDHMTAPFTGPTFQPIVSNLSLLGGDAQQLLEAQPEVFFKVPDETGQLAGGGGLGAVWYGCRKLPRLVATLPGRPLNGLSLGEALDCMGALWESELSRRMFEPLRGARKAAGLLWVLVPCFA